MALWEGTLNMGREVKRCLEVALGKGGRESSFGADSKGRMRARE